MLESCTTALERWGGVNQLVDRWLSERKELISEYIALRDRTPPDTLPDQALKSFCDVPVSYTHLTLPTNREV